MKWSEWNREKREERERPMGPQLVTKIDRDSDRVNATKQKRWKQKRKKWMDNSHFSRECFHIFWVLFYIVSATRNMPTAKTSISFVVYAVIFVICMERDDEKKGKGNNNKSREHIRYY